MTDANQLIQCSQYGLSSRNSDPHIGESMSSTILVVFGGFALVVFLVLPACAINVLDP